MSKPAQHVNTSSMGDSFYLHRRTSKAKTICSACSHEKRGDNLGFGAMSRPDSLAGSLLQGRSAFLLAQVQPIMTHLEHIFMLRGCRHGHDDSLEMTHYRRGLG